MPTQSYITSGTWDKRAGDLKYPLKNLLVDSDHSWAEGDCVSFLKCSCIPVNASFWVQRVHEGNLPVVRRDGITWTSIATKQNAYGKLSGTELCELEEMKLVIVAQWVAQWKSNFAQRFVLFGCIQHKCRCSE